MQLLNSLKKKKKSVPGLNIHYLLAGVSESFSACTCTVLVPSVPSFPHSPSRALPSATGTAGLLGLGTTDIFSRLFFGLGWGLGGAALCTLKC